MAVCALLATGCASSDATESPLSKHAAGILKDPESFVVPDLAGHATSTGMAADEAPAADPSTEPAVVAAAPAAGDDEPAGADEADEAAALAKAQEPAKAEEPAKADESAKAVGLAKAEEPAKAEGPAKADAPAKPSHKASAKVEAIRKAQRAPPEPMVPKTKEIEPQPPASSAGAARVDSGLDATDLYYQGKRQLDSGQREDAIVSLTASLARRPSDRTRALLGRALFDAGRMAEAERVLRGAPIHAEALLLLAQLYQHRGKVSDARKAYKAFLTHNPDHPRADWVRDVLRTL